MYELERLLEQCERLLDSEHQEQTLKKLKDNLEFRKVDTLPLRINFPSELPLYSVEQIHENMSAMGGACGGNGRDQTAHSARYPGIKGGNVRKNHTDP